MTTFSDGVYQYGGAPVSSSLDVSKIFSTKLKGRAWFVDPTSGGNGTGKTPKGAFTTMAQAFSAMASGDIVYFVGDVREQLVTPVQIFDVTIVGCGNRPRHADSAPTNGNQAAATWRAPSSGAVSGQATVRVLQQGWKFVNTLFAMESSTAAGIELVRNAGSGDAERDASHAEILGCVFSGAGVGIRGGATSFSETTNHVLVDGCRFNDMTYAIRTEIISNYWTIRNNEFRVNTNHIVADFGYAFIYNNIFGRFTTDSIELPGSSIGYNVITKNYLSGTYSSAGGYTVSDSTDEWAGNWNTIAGGITVSDPA